MASMERFTAYMSTAERNKLRNDAKTFGCSENWVLRMLIRKHYEMPIPRNIPMNTAERDEAQARQM